MARSFWTLAVAASLLATSAALSPQDIPSDVPVNDLLTSAQTHLIQGQTSEALMYYDAAIARDPSNYLSLFKRGATYLSLGRTNQATEDFNKVLAIQPNFEGAHVQLAKIKVKTADWEGARAEYVAGNKGPDSEEMKELEEASGAAKLAQEAESAKKWEDCVNHAGAAILVASRASSLRSLRSRCRFERGEVEEGLADLQHVLSLRPGDISPHITISATTFYGLGDLENGISQIRKCLHSDPDSKVCKKLHKNEKALQKAYEKIQGNLQRGQTTTAGRALVGTSEDRGLIPKIKEQFEELRQDGSIVGMTRSVLYDNAVEAACQAYTESNHRDVEKYCDEALQLNPASFWGRMQRGKALLKKEEYEASIRILQEAAESRPDMRDKVNPLLQKAQVALKRSKTKDYYKVLGVDSDADERQIKAAFRKASKIYHPDKAVKSGLTKDEAMKKMIEVNEAYEVLSDPELRARFDRGDDPNSTEQQRNPFHGSPFNFQGGGHPFGQQFQFQQGGFSFNF
ncbi:unnamed protein product [Clonostachys rosea]|uniref:J domain-containing protein n=1 Tax=Bionectria ochroleuca TaxID=29856 RepID=A0ABY6TQ21_BIOOC|nr:unnamed protein product [Clonostachys rosea]